MPRIPLPSLLWLTVSVFAASVSCKDSPSCQGPLCDGSDSELTQADAHGKDPLKNIDASTLSLSIATMNSPQVGSPMVDVVVQTQVDSRAHYLKAEICKQDDTQCAPISPLPTRSTFRIGSDTLPDPSILIKVAPCVLPEYASSSEACAPFQSATHTVPTDAIDDVLQQLVNQRLVYVSELISISEFGKDRFVAFAKYVEECYKGNREYMQEQSTKNWVMLGSQLVGSFFQPGPDMANQKEPSLSEQQGQKFAQLFSGKNKAAIKDLTSGFEEDYFMAQLYQKYQSYKAAKEMFSTARDLFSSGSLMGDAQGFITGGLKNFAAGGVGSVGGFISSVAGAIMDLSSNAVLLECRTRDAFRQSTEARMDAIMKKIRNQGCQKERQINFRRKQIGLEELATPFCPKPKPKED